MLTFAERMSVAKVGLSLKVTVLGLSHYRNFQTKALILGFAMSWVKKGFQISLDT